MVTPVSSPTPDEQAAEEAAVAAFAKACEVLGRTPYKTGGRWCIELACDETRDEVRPVIHAAVAAALVVVREQLTQARALLDEIDAEVGECGAWWLAREMGKERPELKHYPDEGWSFCDGCSAAAAADDEARRTTARIRAALNPPPSPPTYTTEEGQKP